MKILKWIIKIIIWLAVIMLAIIGLKYLISGGFTNLKDVYKSTCNSNFWEFVKWIFANKLP